MWGLPAERNLQNQVQDIVIMSMFSKKLGGQRVGRLPAGPPVLGCEGNNPGGTYLFLHN